MDLGWLERGCFVGAGDGNDEVGRGASHIWGGAGGEGGGDARGEDCAVQRVGDDQGFGGGEAGGASREEQQGAPGGYVRLRWASGDAAQP